jgi:hypothetical protein
MATTRAELIEALTGVRNALTDAMSPMPAAGAVSGTREDREAAMLTRLQAAQTTVTNLITALSESGMVGQPPTATVV